MSKKSMVTRLVRSYGRQIGRLAKGAMELGTPWSGAMPLPLASEANHPWVGQGRWLSGMAVGAGGPRSYQLFVPTALDRGWRPPAALMVMLHGCGQTAQEFALVTQMNRFAAREGFLVLYPQQDRLYNPHGCWNWWDMQLGQARAEAATLMQAIQQVSLLHRVDARRIAVAGLSAGGSMAALMGAIYLDRFCAVAMHSGVAPGAAHSAMTALAAMQGHRSEDVALTAVGKARSANARHKRLPPLLVIQGSDDAVVSRDNGVQAAELWAQIAGAQAQPTRQRQLGQRKPWLQTEYHVHGQLCARLCEVQGLDHAWSGGRARHAFSDPQGPDASRMIWRFAKAATS